jgi:hypothetical protein
MVTSPDTSTMPLGAQPQQQAAPMAIDPKQR